MSTLFGIFASVYVDCRLGRFCRLGASVPFPEVNYIGIRTMSDKNRRSESYFYVPSALLFL